MYPASLIVVLGLLVPLMPSIMLHLGLGRGNIRRYRPPLPAMCPWNDRPRSMPFVPLPRQFANLLTIIDELPLGTALIDGSLLGAYRNGGLIPRDHDVDYGLFLEESRGVLGDVNEPKGGLRHFRNHPYERGQRYLPMVDAFVAALFAHPRWPEVHHRSFLHHPAGFLLHLKGTQLYLDVLLGKHMPAEAGGTCRCNFSGVMLNCLANSENMIIRAYGPNYSIPGSKQNWGDNMFPG